MQADADSDNLNFLSFNYFMRSKTKKNMENKTSFVITLTIIGKHMSPLRWMENSY
jgi:hypothetical protein